MTNPDAPSQELKRRVDEEQGKRSKLLNDLQSASSARSDAQRDVNQMFRRISDAVFSNPKLCVDRRKKKNEKK